MRQEQSKPKEEWRQEEKGGLCSQMERDLRDIHLTFLEEMLYNSITVKMKNPHTDSRGTGASTWGSQV